MYLWRRSAGERWWRENELPLRGVAGDWLAVVERPNRSRLQLEVASNSLPSLRKLAKRYGGKIKELPRDWLKRSLRQKTKPIKIGNKRLVIPAGAAFGTGEHATTAMSLRLLEKIARSCKPGWSMLDVGTGTGILALAAKLLGAKKVIGIDNDPIAISISKQNARFNKIRSVEFRVADARKWKRLRLLDVVSANLFSELLIEILPKLSASLHLIFSGILRDQERDVRRALAKNGWEIIAARRRGKWVAMLAASR